MSVTELTNATLPTLSVAHPAYDRSAATVGIVHFGVGNFHRSHQAMYLDALLGMPGDGLEWGICGVGVLPSDAPMKGVLDAQDGLYSLIVRHPDGRLEPSVIGSILEYVFAPTDPQLVFARLTDPAVRIVSLTVTEGGYLKDPATGEFDGAAPGVIHDVANPQAPVTVFGYLIEGLRRRRGAGLAPFTVLSCDNLQGNGHITQRTVLALARRIDPELAAWIEEHVAFPSCMVDRITPATTDADRAALATQFGIADGWPVPAEPFTQWIVEDRFPAGRPALERVGVQLVADVEPYELMKLRLLNASHQALAYLGAPLGYTLVDETMRDDRVRDYLSQYMAVEAAPTLGTLPGIDVDAYIATLLERFSNPGIKDTLVRLATDGSNRMPTFTLPAIRDNLAAGRPVALGAAMCAAWAEYWRLLGTGEIPAAQAPPDVKAAQMTRAALDPDPLAFAAQQALFGDIAGDERFAAAYLSARRALADRGVHAALDDLLGR